MMQLNADLISATRGLQKAQHYTATAAAVAAASAQAPREQ
jgi:hypothetical protein